MDKKQRRENNEVLSIKKKKRIMDKNVSNREALTADQTLMYFSYRTT